MLYLLFSLIIILVILFITANIQVVSYSKKYEHLTISSIGNVNNLNSVRPILKKYNISSIIHRTNYGKKKDIEDIQILTDTEKYAYSITD